MAIVEDLISKNWIVSRDGKQLGAFKDLEEAKKFWFSHPDNPNAKPSRGKLKTAKFKRSDVVPVKKKSVTKKKVAKKTSSTGRESTTRKVSRGVGKKRV